MKLHHRNYKMKCQSGKKAVEAGSERSDILEGLDEIQETADEGWSCLDMDEFWQQLQSSLDS